MRLPRIEQFVGDGDRSHDGEPRIANVAEFSAQVRHARFEIFGKPKQPCFLPLLARHPILAAIDRDVDVAHGCSPASIDGADGVDGNVEAFGNFAIGFFQRARPDKRAVKFVGEPRAIRSERLNTRGQFIIGAIRVAAPLDRALKRVECRRKPPRCQFDIARSGCCELVMSQTVGTSFGHGKPRPFCSASARICSNSGNISESINYGCG